MGRADVKIKKKLYNLMDDFDEAAKILPVLKEQDLKVKIDAELKRMADQVSEEVGF